MSNRRSNPWREQYLDLIPGIAAPGRDRAKRLINNPDNILCFCYGITAKDVIEFIKKYGPEKPEVISEALGAGSSCSSCVPDIAAIIDELKNREEIDIP